MRIGLDKQTKVRIQPQKGATAICQCCGLELTPKCGKIRIHHWAHASGYVCDHWWESETEWHRCWKDEFTLECQEVIKYDLNTTEKHIADVFIHHKNLAIEFQNSSIKIDEIRSREKFYKKMIWVLNCIDSSIETFSWEQAKKNIEEIEWKYLNRKVNSFFRIPESIQNKLIARRDELLNEMLLGEELILTIITSMDKEVEIMVNQHEIGDAGPIGVDSKHFLKKLLSPIFDRVKEDINKIVNLKNTQTEDDKYFGYKWTHRRKTWNHAGMPVFLDMGEHLFWLKSEWILRKITREEFVNYYN
jgi:Competence protein CoiA-like family